jgi:hypothetical protein
MSLTLLDSNDIAEILLKVALNTINKQTNKQTNKQPLIRNTFAIKKCPLRPV